MIEDGIKSKKKAFNLLQGFIGTAKKERVWAIWLVLLFISGIFDCVFKQHINSHPECFFSYEMGNLVSIIVVIWTFTVTVGMYCVSQLETKYYGVRLVDAFFATFSFRRAAAIIIAVAGEMLLLLFSTIMKWKIMLFTTALLQFYTTCFIFALVCLYFTKSAVILMAQEEIQNILEAVENPSKVEQNMKVSLKIAQNTDYENSDERESLFDLLKMISKGKEHDTSPAEKGELIREMSRILVSGMLDSRADYWGKVYPIIFKGFRFSENIEVKKGIIQALAGNHYEDMYQDCYHSCCDLIECRNADICLEEIALWALACYWYYSDPSHFSGLNWKNDYCKGIVKEFPDILQPDKLDVYLTGYCLSLRVKRIDLENHIGYCEEGDKNG